MTNHPPSPDGRTNRPERKNAPVRGGDTASEVVPVDESPAEARLRRLARVNIRPPREDPSDLTIRSTPGDDDARVLSPPEGPDELGRLGGYRVTRRLGRGGMGMVYAAEDMALRREVAVKVMLPGLAADPIARERFLHEARAAARVFHDNLVPIWQVAESRGVPFLVMPLLDGVPLERALGGIKPLRTGVAVRIAREIAVGLAAAHAAGLVHRDIKPSNVWLELGPNGSVQRARVLDFGLARFDTGGATLTKSGVVIGTPSYMAPEQARGRKVDGRADLFSLGVILYQMLTGKLPFDGSDSLAILTALAVDDPAPVRDLNPAVPPALADLVHRLMSKDVDGRPASAAEVVAELRRIEAGRITVTPTPPTPAKIVRPVPVAPPATPPPTPVVRRRPKPPRRRRTGLIVSAVVVAMILAIVGGLVIRLPSSDVPTLASGSTPSTQAGVVVLSSSPAATPASGSQTGATGGDAPVRVFVLAGQSNMTGKAKIVTLDRMADQPRTALLYRSLRTPDGRWADRDDVYVDSSYVDSRTGQRGHREGFLTVGFGEKLDEVGPELTFGRIMGDRLAEPVLIIKHTQGGMSLAEEARPPTADGPTGKYYRELLADLKAVLAKPPEIGGMFADREYKLAGMIWFQGWNDLINNDSRANYEENLATFIRDVRRDLGRPDLPFVIAEMGVDGLSGDDRQIEMREAQAGAAARQEFAGTVGLVKTADLWDTEAAALLSKYNVNRRWTDAEAQAKFERLGSNYGFHYLGSGQTTALIGQRFAEEMTRLMSK